MNLSKRGASMSVGGRGAWLTTGNGSQRVTIGIPGTGLQWYRQRRLESSTPSSPASVLRSLALIFVVLAVAALLIWH